MEGNPMLPKPKHLTEQEQYIELLEAENAELKMDLRTAEDRIKNLEEMI